MRRTAHGRPRLPTIGEDLAMVAPFMRDKESWVGGAEGGCGVSDGKRGGGGKDSAATLGYDLVA